MAGLRYLKKRHMGRLVLGGLIMLAGLASWSRSSTLRNQPQADNGKVESAQSSETGNSPAVTLAPQPTISPTPVTQSNTSSTSSSSQTSVSVNNTNRQSGNASNSHSSSTTVTVDGQTTRVNVTTP